MFYVRVMQQFAVWCCNYQMSETPDFMSGKSFKNHLGRKI